MRLIDADELKKCAIPCEYQNGALTDLCVPLYQIENAPTVEPETSRLALIEDIRKKQMDADKAFLEGYERAKKDFERPQGEWVEELTLDRWVQELPSVYYCSRCRSEPFGDNLYNYCPDCGAKMKGDKE